MLQTERYKLLSKGLKQFPDASEKIKTLIKYLVLKTTDGTSYLINDMDDLRSTIRFVCDISWNTKITKVNN